MMDHHMGDYSISDLENISGIKAHTIRIWEKRYDLLSPKRTTGNSRLYSDDDLRKILNISVLVKRGIKISSLQGHTASSLGTIVTNLSAKEETGDFMAESLVNKLIEAALTYDEHVFEKNFASAVLRFGIKEAYRKIIYPFLVRIGLLWGSGELLSVNEHYVSNLVRQKLFTAIDALPLPDSGNKKWLLFLPEHEQHEIGLLYSYYVLKQMNFPVTYLGQNVPFADLKSSIKKIKPDYFLFFLVRHFSKEDLTALVKQLEKETHKNARIVICSNENNLPKFQSSKCTVLHTAEAFDGFLEELK